MMRRNRRGRAVLATVALSVSASAQTGPPASTFTITARPADPNVTLSARSGATLVPLAARPASAVRIDGPIPAAVAAQLGGKADALARDGRLYGWPERPGLFCDLLRNSGLGASSICLEDSDADGRFDRFRKLGFDSALSQILLVTPSGKIVGARFKGDAVPLAAPVRFTRAAPANDATGKLAIEWRRVKVDGGRHAVEIALGTPGNHTGTAGVAPRMLRVPGERLPVSVELYGVRLRLHALDEAGVLRYSVLGAQDGAPVPLFFRGAVTPLFIFL